MAECSRGGVIARPVSGFLMRGRGPRIFIWTVQGGAIRGTRRCGDWLGSPDHRQGQLSGVVQGREGADTGRASRINVSQADGVAAIRIDIAAGSVYLRSCP